METTNLAQLDYPLGMPLAWVYTPDGEMIVDQFDRPIARNITDFEYTYDEEEDDRCNISFHFQEVTQFDLPYLDNDVVILVQWGFMTPEGKFIKSPKRKVAIQDIRTDYGTNGLKLELECADLLGYLKAYKTSTVRKFENPNAKLAINAIGKGTDNFLDWLNEISTNNFVATVTEDRTSVRFDMRGGYTVSEYDRENDRYLNVARDRTAVPKKFFNTFYVAKTIKGKSKSLTNAINDQLKLMLSADGGNFIMDTIDNHLHIRTRNFDQKIYKTYLFNGGFRDLIDFKASTDTRKTSEDENLNQGVNPFTKETDVTKVNYADTSEEENIVENTTKEPVPKTTEEVGLRGKREWTEYNNQVINEVIEKENYLNYKNEIRAYIEKAEEIFVGNVKENITNQQELPDFKYTKVLEQSSKIQKGTPKQIRISVPANQIICTPEFQSVLDEVTSDRKKQVIRSQGLVGYAVEKIQRKYEASATVLGDPSLIKAKVYGFFGLANRDNGKWYATRVSHKISKGNGYLCHLELIKKPKTIGRAELNYVSKRNMLDEGERLELNSYVSSKAATSYQSDVAEAFRPEETGQVEGMEDRVKILEADADHTVESLINISPEPGPLNTDNLEEPNVENN